MKAGTYQNKGLFGREVSQYLELHNHIGENKFNYGYPVIQYKSIGGVQILLQSMRLKILIDIFYDVKEIDMKDKIMSILEKGYVLKTKEIGTAEGMVEYKFLTPWLALNQDNYERFANSGIDERTDILKKILTGNILSMAKGLGYWVEEPIEVLIKLNPVKINYKNRKMIDLKVGL